MDTALLNAIFENTIDGIVIIDGQGIIRFTNPALVSLFEYSREELIGLRIEQLMQPADSERHQLHIDRYIKKGNANIIGIGREVQGLKKDGRCFPFRLAVSEVNVNGNRFFTVIVHDLTKEREAAEQLKSYADNLETHVEERTRELQHVICQLELAKEELSKTLVKEQELNRVKSRFVSMASHEFRSPLSNIQLSASLIEHYYDKLDKDRVINHLKKIKTAVGDLTDTLNDFLSVERIESGNTMPAYSEFNIKTFCDDLMIETAPLQKSGQCISYNHTGEVMVNLDKNLLKHCLSNLLTNAIKYSGDDAVVQLQSTIIDGKLTLKVTDNGIGIPLNDQQRLFEAFYRATNTNDIPGTGLGLSIVKKYVDIMKGKVIFSSKEGVGTEFTVSFPIGVNLEIMGNGDGLS